jgi:hypothetical protein
MDRILPRPAGYVPILTIRVKAPIAGCQQTGRALPPDLAARPEAAHNCLIRVPRTVGHDNPKHTHSGYARAFGSQVL